MIATASVAAVLLAAALIVLPMRGAAPTPVRIGDTPVLVELFTSHGCSSCPPADQLLSYMKNDPPLRGRVILLAYHVDYWDRLGWKDPFSSKVATLRQAEYVRAFRLESSYTPQAVIDGAKYMVGSDSGAVYRTVAEESGRKAEATLKVAVKDGLAEISGQGSGDLQLAIYEDGITTKITAGENAGRTITNDAIVRQFTRVGRADSKPFTKRIPLTLDPSWNRARSGVVAFIQDSETKRVKAVAQAQLR
ncbi:MAG TPA: DUF1223 domain-containing protein [Thermoanaerobaculia bacterium]|nr:DUF1223 domain-containing protein [Thermoanaerobaculia bacterium]